MRDVRELILLRLKFILDTIDGVETTWRDRADVPKEECPQLTLLDGREEKRTTTRGNRRMPPAIMVLKPQIWLQLPESDDNTQAGVGEELSALRVKVLAAIFADIGIGSLADLQGENGEIEYLGSQTDMEIGSDITGNMVIDMSLSYFFDPEDMQP